MIPLTGPAWGIVLFLAGLVYLLCCLVVAIAVVHVARALIPDQWVTRAGHLTRWDA